ncbi:MAG: sigma-70 family RNA polymerase sigma factor [Bacilli bacterium]|nr:sigma-70 family RNA polymerase sigma factor [Bacilli bacterium]
MSKEFLYYDISVEDVIKSLANFILDVKEEYLDKGYCEKDINELLNRTIKNGIKNYQTGLNVEFETYFQDLILESFLESNKFSINNMVKVVNYINTNLVLSNSIYENIKSVQKLSKFLTRNNIEMDFESTLYLSKECKLYDEIIGNIVYYINEQKNNLIANFSKVSVLVEDYCTVKEIELYHDEDAKISYSSNSEVTYLTEIGRYPLLTVEEEKELTKLVAEGDDAARKKLISHNLRLVANIAKRYVNRGLDYLDIIQNGNLGLIKAADEFDYKKGYKFSTYATWWIRAKINRGLSDQVRTIKKPVYLEEKIRKMKIVENELIMELERIPTEEELANKLKINLEQLRRMKFFELEPTSLDAVIGDDNLERNYYVPADDNTEITAEVNLLGSELLNSCLDAGLNERDIEILKYRYGFYNNTPYTLVEVGKIYNLTHERVRQLEKRALNKLKKYYNITNPKIRKRQIS